MTEDMDDSKFIERLSEVLREPEVLDDEFEQRVMAAVRAEERSWWRRPVTLTFAPARAVAMAAGFALVFALGTAGTARLLTPSAAGVVATTDTVHLVRFVVDAPGAARVSLVGDFTSWQSDLVQLERVGVGDAWSVSVPLSSGRHEYAFVVDGERWVADPLAQRRTDEFGVESSVLRVGADVRPGV